jgi:hypothetical protein
MSYPVPWSGEVRTNGSPAVKFTPSFHGERLERSESLVVIHGEHAVKVLVLLIAEKSVGRIRTEAHDIVLLVSLSDGRRDDISCSSVPSTPFSPACGLSDSTAMRGRLDSEIAFERVVEYAQFLRITLS